MVDGAQRMKSGLIKDLLAYSRAGATYAARPGPWGDGTSGRASRSMPQWGHRGSRLPGGAAVVSLPMVWGDVGQLAEVVTNLVSTTL